MATQRTRRSVDGHTIRWFVFAWNGDVKVKLPHTANMRGTWGWDASCSCGWGSRTGGATRGSVEREVREHKFDASGDWRML